MTPPSDAEEKIWGLTWPLFRDQNLLVMRLHAVAGGYCSEHFHRYRHNLFIVHSGVLYVNVENGPDNWETVHLAAGQQLLVPAGIFHQFDAQTEVLCDEVYYPKDGNDIDIDDIIRRTEGGRR